MLNVLDVARYIVNYSYRQNYGVSNLKLQGLLYFVQAYYLSLTDSHKPCFKDKIEAWDCGVIVSVAYHEFKCYGAGSIPYLMFADNKTWITEAERVTFDEDVIPKEDRLNIEAVVDEFKDYSATALLELTRNQKPWKDAHVPYHSSIISKKSIRKYFEV